MAVKLVGVRTTGIYCRSDCSARALAKNRFALKSAAAAYTAGLRPCLRCRPDRVPLVPGGDGTTVVDRAIRLIAEGALDDATESALAARVGVSGRHLRRLFIDHVGATPAVVAAARRAHFARRLLDETDLKVSEIAEASGFSSVRQMNRLIASTFRFTPQQLRAKRRQRDRLVADGGLRLRLASARPLDFAAMLEAMRPRLIPGVESIDGAVYRRSLLACGYPGIIEVSADDDAYHLQVVVHLPSLSGLIDHVSRLRRIFALDRSEDSVRDFVPGPWDPFETAVAEIARAALEPEEAPQALSAIGEKLGTPVPGLAASGIASVFPSATDLAATARARIAACGIPPVAANSITALAAAMTDGSLRLDCGSSLEALNAALRDQADVDEATAMRIARYAALHPDAVLKPQMT